MAVNFILLAVEALPGQLGDVAMHTQLVKMVADQSLRDLYTQVGEVMEICENL